MFQFKQLLDHGSANPIVARLSLQILKILEQCDASDETRDKVQEVYVHSLLRKLIRCYEIERRFAAEFTAAVKKYQPPSAPGTAIDVPQVARLEEECHNFLYEAKNYIRDLLRVINALYGTSFSEASEFYRDKKRGLSVVSWAVQRFGKDERRTKFLREVAGLIKHVVDARNAAEHPGGYSGTLRIRNFELLPDRRIDEPVWYREHGGRVVEDPVAIRAILNNVIDGFLVLGESVFVSWADQHLKMPDLMRLTTIPPELRDPDCPVKYEVTISSEVEQRLAAQERKRG